MCLFRVDATYEPPLKMAENSFGYKLFYSYEATLTEKYDEVVMWKQCDAFGNPVDQDMVNKAVRGPYYGSYIPLGEWFEETANDGKTINSDQNQQYPRGYHAFATLDAAKKYRESEALQTTSIYKVELDQTVAKGTQQVLNYVEGRLNVEQIDTLVVRRIKVLEEVIPGEMPCIF